MEQEADKLIGSHICYRIYQHSTSRGCSYKQNKKNNTTKATLYSEILQYDISNWLDNVTYHYNNNDPYNP